MQSVKVIFLLFAVGFIECTDKKTMAYRSHVKMLDNYPCGKPQPRVFEAKDVIPKDLYDEEEYPGSKVTPVVTVLHRCNNTGCCENKTERCMAADIKPVVVTFSISLNSVMFLDVPLTNHTQCSCSDFNNETYDSEAKKNNLV